VAPRTRSLPMQQTPKHTSFSVQHLTYFETLQTEVTVYKKILDV